jgi:amidophosphoribosyltransferase
MPSAKELIAHNRTEDEIGELIGADWLVFQDLDDLVQSSMGGKLGVDTFECSVFDGEYITGDIDQDYLDQIDAQRNDDNKKTNHAEADNAEVI